MRPSFKVVFVKKSTCGARDPPKKCWTLDVDALSKQSLSVCPN